MRDSYFDTTPLPPSSTAPSATPASPPLTVSELTHSIKWKLENSFPQVQVVGEVSNFKPNSSGHLYFDLKDAQAKIPAVFFRGKAHQLACLPKEGDQVIVKGSLSVYAPHGRYQLIVSTLQFAGTGELLARLEALKRELKARGYFDKERKKPLPKFPRHIGVITSPTGAVIQDIIQILTRRTRGFHLRLIPVKVQGPGSAEEIAQAIGEFNKYKLADVLIVGRGGGSLEDLWAFNEPIVAKAIFESEIPIISAVGHETDFTIADFVADVRAPTPSAAAEMVASEQQTHLTALNRLQLTYARVLSMHVAKDEARLGRFSSHPLLKDPSRLFLNQWQQIDHLETECDKTIRHLMDKLKLRWDMLKRAHDCARPDFCIPHLQEKFTTVYQKISTTLQNSLNYKKLQLTKLVDLLYSLDPKNVLKRGFTILFEQKGGSAIVTTDSLAQGKRVWALLADGEAEFVTEHIHKQDDSSAI